MWWDSLSDVQQIAFFIASVATVLMILMIIMMIIGMDGGEGFDGDIGDMDVDFDFDGDLDGIDGFNSDSIFSISGLKIVTIRGALAFMSIGGWMTYALAGTLDTWLAVVIGLISGVIAAFLLALAMRAIYQLESSGNLDYRTAIGKTAVVYIRVPKNSNGKGKVMLNHQGRLIEVDAITRGDTDITSKQEVKVIGLVNETTLVVENIKEEK